MILNARTGELSIDDEVLNDSQVLQVLSDHFNLLEGTEQAFTLQTFRRMFTLYPALTYVNGYAESFLDQAKLVKPRFHVVSPESAESADPGEPYYESLELAKRVTIRISELARTSSEIVLIEPPKGVVSIVGDQARAFTVKVEYEDKPYFETQEDIDLSGMADGTPHGLDMDRLSRLMHLKITMPGTSYVYIREFANKDRTRLDHNLMIENTVIHPHHGISLLEAIDAVLYSINLEDEEDYLEERAMLEEMLKDLDMGSLPVLTLPRDDESEEEE